MKLLIENGYCLDYVDQNDFTPLLISICRKHYKCAKLLIKSGCNVNKEGYGNTNPLIAASYLGNDEIVKLLLDAGADKNKKGTFISLTNSRENILEKQTSLYFAMMNKNPKCIDLLT